MHVCVLGSGAWSRVHLAALGASPHVERVSIWGRNEVAVKQLAAEFPGVETLPSSGDPLASDADVVDILLPHHLHSAFACEALAAGKHVICEKPGATRLEDFDAMVAEAETRQRRLLIVMNQLYNPVFAKLRARVQAGAIGRPFLSVENSYRNASENYRRPDYWRTSRLEAGGGVLVDGGFHMVYRHLDTLAGQGIPQWVLADTSQLAVRVDGAQVAAKGEDFASVVVGFPGSLRIQWAHGWTLAADPTRSRQSFLAGTEGTLELTDDPALPLALRRSAGSEAIAVPAGPRTGPETTRACLLDYLDCLATGRQPERATLTLGRLTLATILAAYRSGRSGQREPL